MATVQENDIEEGIVEIEDVNDPVDDRESSRIPSFVMTEGRHTPRAVETEVTNTSISIQNEGATPPPAGGSKDAANEGVISPPTTGNLELYTPSDLALDRACTPCTREGRFVDVSDYCSDCKENLCTKCVQDHRKFPILKEHQIAAKSKSTQGQQSRTDSHVKEKCYYHPDEFVCNYCKDHRELVCLRCIASEHSTCNELTSLLKASAGVGRTKEFRDVKEKIKKVQKDLKSLQTKRIADSMRLDQRREDVLNQIYDVRRRINKTLDKLEKSARDELQTRCDECLSEIRRDVYTVDDMVVTMENMSAKLESGNKNSESQVFVNVKKAVQYIHAASTVTKTVTRNTGKGHLSFTLDPTIENMINSLQAIGVFESPQSSSVHTYLGQFVAKTREESQNAGILYYGSTILDDGRVLLTDWDHRLKLLDTTYKVIDSCTLQGAPFGVCAISSSEAAVSLTLKKRVEIVSIGDKLKSERKFDIGMRCRGIAYSNGELFVACGGTSDSREGEGQIRTYDISGKLIRVISKNPKGGNMFCIPLNICTNSDGSLLYVTDDDKGVIKISNHGNVISVFKDTELSTAYGLCSDGEDGVYATGYDSNNVLHIDSDGNTVAMTLKRSDGVSRPISVCYDIARSRLLVTMFHNKAVKVYKLQEAKYSL